MAVHYAAPCFSYINDFCFQNVAGMMSPNVFEAENFQTFTDVVGTGPYIREEMISGDCTRLSEMKTIGVKLLTMTKLS